MKITLLGSLGNINRIVVPRLIADGHDVTVISSSEKRIAAIEALGAHAAVGDMSDVTFLTEQFTGRDVVYLMISGSSPDLFGSAKQLGDIFKNAVMAAKVKKKSSILAALVPKMTSQALCTPTTSSKTL